MSSRAHARRRLAAWDRYLRRWPFAWTHGRDPAPRRWWLRTIRHRPYRPGGPR